MQKYCVRVKFDRIAPKTGQKEHSERTLELFANDEYQAKRDGLRRFKASVTDLLRIGRVTVQKMETLQ